VAGELLGVIQIIIKYYNNGKRKNIYLYILRNKKTLGIYILKSKDIVHVDFSNFLFNGIILL